MLMKKKLSFMMVALVAIAAFAVQVTRRAYSDPSPYSYAFSTSDKTFTEDGTKTLNGVDWTLAVTWTDNTKKDYNKDTDGGMKIGSNTKSVEAMSLTSASDAFGTNYITSVKVTTAARSQAFPALTVTVGGQEFKYVSGDQKLSSAPVGSDKTAVYEFVGVGQGAIVINWDGSASSLKGAIYVKNIEVAFQADAPAGPAVAEPVFSLDGGTYAGTQSVTITCATEDANIYYTTDGTTPTAESTAYTSAISVTETTTIKAIGIKGEDKSEVATATYTIVEKIDGGSLSAPLTIAQAKTLIDTKAGAALAHPDNKVYVKAVATVGEATVDQYGQLTYKLSEGTDEFDVYQGKNLENVAFTEETKGDIDGKLVTVYGNIKKYNESYEFDRGNYVVKVEIAPADVTVDASDITDGDITAAITAKAAGAPVKNLTINLAADGAYAVSAPIVAGGNVVINGNGATIDASALAGNFIEMTSRADNDSWKAIENISIQNATIKGLKKALFYSAYKQYDINLLAIDNCVIEQAADAITLDFTKGSVARNVTIENSTVYAPTATTKSFFSSQSAQRLTDITGVDSNVDKQTFTFKNSTLYNLAPSKNFFTHRQNSQKWLKFVAKNNIFVDCGKSGQTIKGMNGGGSSANPQFDIDGNVFNYGGADTGAAEATGDADEPVQNTIAGVVTFTDAANGDFNATLGTEDAPATATTAVGDPRWTVTNKQIPSNITIGATELEAAANDISAALATAATGKIVGNLTVNLAADGAYKVTAPIEAGGSVVINGAEGAVIDASALTAPFIALSATPTAAFLPKNDGSGNTDYYGVEKVHINNVKVTGLKQSIFWDSNKKYCVVDFTIDNSIFQLATESVNYEALIAFQAGGAKDFTVKNSTISGNNAVAKYFLRYNNSARIDRYGFVQATDTWSFTYENNTFYGLLKSDGQWGNYSGITGKQPQGIITVNNNIWVDCDANTMRRMLNSKNFGSGFHANSAMANNVFNREGAVVDQGNYGNGSDIKGVVTFTDAANGDFNGNVALSWGAEQPAAQPGDPRWALTYSQKGIMEDGKYFIMGLSYDNPQQWLAGGKLSDFGMEFTATFDATALTYTLQNAEGKYLQSDLTFGETAFGWTVDNDAVYGQNIYMKDGDTKKYIGVNEEKNLVLTETATDPTIGWGFFSADYFWAMMAPRVIVGSTELTGTAEAGIADIKNAMTLNELTGLWEKTIKLVEITAEKQPNFKVALNGDAAKAYPAEARTITLADFGAEAQPGFYNITITYNDAGNVVGVSGVKVEPTDIVITPADLGADYGVINETLEKALDGKLPKSITINLGEGINYFVTKSITTAAPLTINGATGATIDASALTGDFITLNGTTEMVEKPDHTYDASHHYIANVTVKDVKILGLKGSFIKDAQKTLLEKLDVENAVIEMAANKQVINFQSKGYVGEVVFKNSTLYSSLDKHEQFFAQYGSRPKNIEGSWLQQFDIEGCTFYNIAVGKNVCDFPMNSQTTNVYTLKNNIFVNVGKSGQTVVGFNKGGVSANPAWTVDANVFNYDGADKSADEVAKAGKKAEEDIVKNSVAGVVTFTDAANGDFNGKIKLAPGTVAPATLPGDARWTLTTEATKLYIIGDMNSWNRTAMTEMTFNTETQAFEYEYAPTTTAYFAFADYQMTEAEAAADIDWSIFNTYRYAIGENDQNVTLNAPVALLKVNGTIVLQPVKAETSYKISVAADFSTVTVAGEAKPILPYVVAGSSAELFGTAWDAAAEANAMTLNETTGNYEITYSNVTLSAGNIEYKVVKDGSTWLPESGNLILNIAEAGSYNVTFTINPNTNEITGVATSTTGINAVKADALKDAQIYTISGQRVDKAQKGLYIVNGRKVVVK